ncbi:MAG: hypothetical protein AB1529_06025 [Candidatus Micrarchaeota archaeon]
MAKGADYRIKKLEKGPLQRFKNQNLLIKKFGEIGLQVYKAITGKRTTAELQKDLGIESALFDQVVNYMQDAGMIELEPTSGKPQAEAPPPKEEPEEEKPAEEEEKPARKLEEIPPEEELGPAEEELPPLEEKPAKKPKGEKAPAEKEKPFEEFEFEAPKKEEEFQFEAPPAKKKKPAEEELSFEEIKPIEFGEEMAPEEKPKKKPPKKKVEEIEFGEEVSPVSMEEEAPPPEKPPEAPPAEFPKEEEIGLSFEEPARAPPEEPELSPVEKIISDKYGDIGLQVYSLIDGQRTAEEIMRETGLTEPKLVEILDFMDEQGIIKLDYPKGAGGPAQPPPPSAFGGPQMAPPQAQPAAGARKEEGGFAPLTEGEESLDEARAVPSPVETPIKAPIDIVKSVQLKARLMLKFPQNRGGKVLDQIDGKNDVLDISLKLDLPLYEVSSILGFMMENGMIILKPMSRADVRKKYGDDGYAVYKRFGKEGLMLYELIGKEMTIKQMAEKITTDKAKIIDMFIFIHKVLGIELPIDRDVLAKQLGL